MYGAQLELRLEGVERRTRLIRIDVEGRDMVETGIDGSFEPVPAEFGPRPAAEDTVIEFLAGSIEGKG